LNQPLTENGRSILRSPTPGPRLYGTFTFLDREGRPIDDLEVDIWHASPVGLYENHDDTQAEYNLRGKFRTGPDGVVRFKLVRPVVYPIPTNTTVGQLLAEQNRHSYRPAHIHVLAHKAGFKTLINQTYERIMCRFDPSYTEIRQILARGGQRLRSRCICGSRAIFMGLDSAIRRRTWPASP
jgi:catechol 1,2-dioxygenase